jgi:hypothetical protein
VEGHTPVRSAQLLDLGSTGATGRPTNAAVELRDAEVEEDGGALCAAPLLDPVDGEVEGDVGAAIPHLSWARGWTERRRGAHLARGHGVGCGGVAERWERGKAAAGAS